MERIRNTGKNNRYGNLFIIGKLPYCVKSCGHPIEGLGDHGIEDLPIVDNFLSQTKRRWKK